MNKQTKSQKVSRAFTNGNVRVEADKAWETSGMRIGSIALITYVFAAILLWTIGASHPLRNALVPTIGFWLSTQSLPFLKRWWIRTKFRK